MKPVTYKVSRKVRLPPKKYDESMWLRKCPPGVRSCFKARGNWDSQKPVFRGCSGVQYDHGTVCKREMQAVEVTPGKPKVRKNVVMKILILLSHNFPVVRLMLRSTCVIALGTAVIKWILLAPLNYNNMLSSPF